LGEYTPLQAQSAIFYSSLRLHPGEDVPEGWKIVVVTAIAVVAVAIGAILDAVAFQGFWCVTSYIMSGINPLGAPTLRAQTLVPIRAIAAGLPFHDMPSLLVGCGKIHDLHDLKTLQCSVPGGVLPAAPARHGGRATADKRGTSRLVAGGGHRLGGLIEANRIHCRVRLGWKGASGLKFALEEGEGREHQG